jgi:hypothetical protein
MEAACTFETLVNMYQAGQGSSPEDSHLHTRHREKLKTNKLFMFLLFLILQTTRLSSQTSATRMYNLFLTLNNAAVSAAKAI